MPPVALPLRRRLRTPSPGWFYAIAARKAQRAE